VYLKDGKGRILAYLTKSASQSHLDGATIYDVHEKPVLDVEQYDNGTIKHIAVRQSGRFLYDWGFCQNGTLEYVTTYKDNRGIRQHFDQEGKASGTTHISVHGS
jgi:hypothetical protein